MTCVRGKRRMDRRPGPAWERWDWREPTVARCATPAPLPVLACLLTQHRPQIGKTRPRWTPLSLHTVGAPACYPVQQITHAFIPFAFNSIPTLHFSFLSLCSSWWSPASYECLQHRCHISRISEYLTPIRDGLTDRAQVCLQDKHLLNKGRRRRRRSKRGPLGAEE